MNTRIVVIQKDGGIVAYHTAFPELVIQTDVLDDVPALLADAIKSYIAFQFFDAEDGLIFCS